jgi:predicted O-linked N-acetylglucosamine transferase (SPINDLY family)
VKDEITCYDKALRADPDDAQTYLNLGNALQYQGELDRAITCYEKALEKKPDYPEAYNNLGSALITKGELNEAAKCHQKALLINPYYAEAYNNLGSIHQNQGEFTKGIFYYRQAIEIKPDYVKAHSNLLYSLHYDSTVGANEHYEEAKYWWQRQGLNIKKNSHSKTNRVQAKRIKIGYVSPDFREHSVSYFFLPFLKYQDRESFEVFCYSEVKREDKFTQKIKELSDHWRSIVWHTDDSVAEQIKKDGIDILVDLAGHTAGNRLLVFARRPAPVQITWLGYPNTTGMPVMDYRLTDDIADPVGEADKYHSETLIRLPDGFLCYRPPDDAPPVSKLPAPKTGGITFGSFNNLPKINEKVIGLWSRLLQQVPDSCLLLKSRQFADDYVRQRFLGLFSANGVASERIRLLPRTPSTAGHLALYHQVDIGLDPFPYNGTTTTCEALWMGVPVITLRGNRHAGRVGASILTRVGLEELIAESEEQYVETGIKLAQDLDGLKNLRAEMRPRMQASPLCDGKNFAGIMEKVFRGMWHSWCGLTNNPKDD